MWRDFWRRQVGGDEVAADFVLLQLFKLLAEIPFQLLYERDELRYVFAELDLDGVCFFSAERGEREAWRLSRKDGAEEYVERTHGGMDLAAAGRQHVGDLSERPLQDSYSGEYPDDALLSEVRLVGEVEIIAKLALYLGAAGFDGYGKGMSAGNAPFGRNSGIVVAAAQNLFREGDGFGKCRIGYGTGRLGGGLDGDEEIDVPFTAAGFFKKSDESGKGGVAVCFRESRVMLHGASIVLGSYLDIYKFYHNRARGERGCS